ncbi:MAG: DUF4465 domain-containing protein [Lewinellaceae bacterium]|nr:DUF4465 domain-containing protein [Saprospiraceae bacterium]MCB9340128.1 DUF4465 domain-containing protein [Lewinellaceae bacterium]
MKQHMTLLFAMAWLGLQAQTTATFENYNLSPGEFLNNSHPASAFSSGNVHLPNSFDGSFWSGWAISATTDATTPGFQNEYSAITGAGADGSITYAVAYVIDKNLIQLGSGAAGNPVEGLFVTNSTYAYLSMLEGDLFAKKFGGEDGDDPDFFKLTIKKYLNGQLGTDSIDFYLADYRFADNSQDYIVDKWTYLDLSPLGPADSLVFSLSSSDVGQFGMNTPAYFCIDNVTTAGTSATSVVKELPVHIFPNPAHDFLMVEGEAGEGATFSIFDARGSLVQTGFLSNQKISLAPGLPGAYHLVLANKDGRSTGLTFIVK